jgi:hypothetical protein
VIDNAELRPFTAKGRALSHPQRREKVWLEIQEQTFSLASPVLK